MRRPRLAIIATHPIQYFVPIYRALAGDPDIEIKVFFASDTSVRGGLDQEFGVKVAWDIPLLEGYPHEFLKCRPLPILRRGELYSWCPTLRERLVAGHFDAILVPGYTLPIYLHAIKLAKDLNLRLLMRGDSQDGTGVKRSWLKAHLRDAALRILYRRVSGALAVGSYMARHFESRGVSRKRIFWSPHCVDNDFFRSRMEQSPDSMEMRKSLGLSECRLVGLYCGKLIARKSLPTLIKAVESMKHRSDLGLIFVGDGDLRAEAEAAIARAGVRAAFVGFRNQTELPAYYRAADFVVLPSATLETWGLVVNEAMSCGLPAVVCDRVGCAEDLIIPGQTGYTFPADDFAALADILDRMAGNVDYVKEMGRRASALIERFGVGQGALGIKQALTAVTGGSIAQTDSEHV